MLDINWNINHKIETQLKLIEALSKWWDINIEWDIDEETLDNILMQVALLDLVKKNIPKDWKKGKEWEKWEKGDKWDDWEDWIDWKNGKNWKDGTNWKNGLNWKNWKDWKNWYNWEDWESAYELAVIDGFKWTLEEWLKSLEWKQWERWVPWFPWETWPQWPPWWWWDANFSYDVIEEDLTIPINQQMIVYEEIEINSELTINGTLILID